MLAGVIQAIPFDNLLHPALSHPDGRDLRRQVTPAFLRRARVPADELDDFLVEPPAPGQLYRREDHPFLVQLGGEGQGAGGHSAHVSVVSPVGYEAGQFSFAVLVHKHRGNQGDVRQVGAAQVGVVQDDHIPGPQCARKGIQRCLHRSGHGPQVNGLVRGLGHHLAGGVKNRAGEVPPLLDVGRICGPEQGHAHLFGHRDEHVLENFQTNGINRHGFLRVSHKGKRRSRDSSST